MAGRVIFHIDMNSFYASVEQSHDPALKGKALAIAGNPRERRGIIVTCSYEARAHGIYTTMQVHEAKRKYPELILLPPNFERYRAASKAMFDILRSYTDLVEPVSIDEGYVDVTELTKERHAMELAEEIQQRMKSELDLPCSLGIAPNKFLAKTASDMKKPMGITILRKRDIQEKLWPLPVIEMHGIGESTAEKLKRLSIATIGDLATANTGLLKEKMGKNGLRLQNRANGVDDRIVDPDSIYDTKSVGTSTTLPVDETDEENLKSIFRKLSEKVANRLEAKELAGPTVSIQTRSSEWQNRTRSLTLRNTVWKSDDIFRNAWQLFTKHWNGEPLRLVGVTVSNVAKKGEMTEQLSIFNFQEHAKEEPILDLMSKLETKFGKSVVIRGTRTPKTAYESETSFSRDLNCDEAAKRCRSKDFDCDEAAKRCRSKDFDCDEAAKRCRSKDFDCDEAAKRCRSKDFDCDEAAKRCRSKDFDCDEAAKRCRSKDFDCDEAAKRCRSKDFDCDEAAKRCRSKDFDCDEAAKRCRSKDFLDDHDHERK